MDIVLQEAVSALTHLPQDRQRQLGELLLDAALPTITFTPRENQEIDHAISELDAGIAADPKEVKVLFARHRA